MIRTWRVATREYLENTKTKGFWLGILMFPLMIVIFSQVPQFLEDRATPTRHFVLIDRSDEFGTFVEQAVALQNRKGEFEALQKFIRKHRPPQTAEIDVAAVIEQLDQMLPMVGAEAGDFSAQDLISRDLDSLLPDEFVEDAQAFAFLRATLLSQLPEGAPEFEPPRPRFQRVPLPADIPESLPDDELEDALRPWLTGDRELEVEDGEAELFALLLLPRDIGEPLGGPLGGARKGFRYWSSNLADTDLESAGRRRIATELRRRAYAEEGVDPEIVSEVQGITLAAETLDPKKEAGEEKVSLVDKLRQWAPVGFVYLLWISIFTTAQMLLNNMIEEKSNRVVEVLLSSVTPGELMTGKLLGIALLGLTMLGAWMISLLVVLEWKAGPGAEWAIGLLEVAVTPQMLVPFAVYFVLGYLMYAAIFGSIGSVCSTIKDAQNFMGPVMMVLMVPMITMFFIPRDPNGTLATVLSWIPLYTPFVMMNRAAADPPAFDLYGTMILLVVSAGGMLWASARIFRIGMLRTGQPPRLLELLRWITRPS